MKKIYILATGGTIAGSAKKSQDSLNFGSYTSGEKQISQLLEEIPSLGKLAQISAEQFVNIGSQDMTSEICLNLARRVDEILREFDGVVITHGTDTMEESAYFLNLMINSDKPVILTGAMRNSDSLSSDGALNLYNAIAVATNENARKMGVMVVINDEIYSARDVSKTNTNLLNTFMSPNSGKIGVAHYGEVKFYAKSLRAHTYKTPFCADKISPSLLDKFARVEIIFAHQDIDGAVVRDAIKRGAKGLVIATFGNGNVGSALQDELKFALENGVAIVLSSRTGSGVVSADENGIALANFILADNLNPQKARILLLISLLHGLNLAQIAGAFKTY